MFYWTILIRMIIQLIIVCYRCSQHNRNLEQNVQNENGSTNMDDHCHQCLTPWKKGHFIMKTIPKSKNNKLKKNPRKFILVNLITQYLIKNNFKKLFYEIF